MAKNKTETKSKTSKEIYFPWTPQILDFLEVDDKTTINEFHRSLVSASGLKKTSGKAEKWDAYITEMKNAGVSEETIQFMLSQKEKAVRSRGESIPRTLFPLAVVRIVLEPRLITPELQKVAQKVSENKNLF